MATVEIGTRVRADPSGATLGVPPGAVLVGTVIGVTSERVTIRADSPYDGQDVFDVYPERVQPL